MKRLALAAVLLTLPGCGYALLGRGTSVDPSIKRIGVPVFKDSTGKPGLDQKVTQMVIEELLKRGGFAVVKEATGVDAVVEGELINYSAAPIGFSEEGQLGQTETRASRFAIILTARVRYAKVGAEEPIWVNDAFLVRDEYDIADPANFVDREDQAIERLVQAFARSLVASMLEGF
jgi:hypothetical protein